MREWVIADMVEHDVGVDADCIVATGLNAADPHYSPQDGGATSAAATSCCWTSVEQGVGRMPYRRPDVDGDISAAKCRNGRRSCSA
jgi:hypothetical protein